VEVGYFFSPTVSVSITGGLPPTEDVMGAGSLAAAGKLGELNYGPAAVMAQYRFAPMGAFQPYVGAGVAVMYVFGDDDAAATNLEVENAAGPALQVGAEYMLNERLRPVHRLQEGLVRHRGQRQPGGRAVHRRHPGEPGVPARRRLDPLLMAG
jgi:hypothetical protein